MKKIKEYYEKRKLKHQELITKQKICEHDWKPAELKYQESSGIFWFITYHKGSIEAKGYICCNCEKELFPTVE